MTTNHQIFISTEGNDGNLGTKTSPFLSPQRAVEEVVAKRALKNGPVQVFFRQGVYNLTKPILIPVDASGTDDEPVSFSAYEKECVTLSGGRRVTEEWRYHCDGIYKCYLEEMKGTFDQLFVNGKRQERARYPKKGDRAYIYPSKASEWPVKQLHIDQKTFTKKQWANPETGVIHIFGATKWGNMQWEIESYDENQRLFNLGKGGFQINDVMQGEEATGIDTRSDYYVENIFEELDNPGEWFYNEQEQTLYLIPEEGVNPNEATIEYSRIDQLIRFVGSQEEPVHHVSISGLTLTGTKPTYLNTYEAPSLGDWTIHRGGAIFYEGTEDCTIKNCQIKAIGGNAIFVNLYNRRLTIESNHLTELGESGICLVGNKQMAIGSNKCFPKDILIYNNEIHNIGIYGKQTAGVFMSVTCNNTISHNHIYNLPRAAICINDGTWGGHIIEYNDVHDTVKETCDHGCLNSWGRDRFWCLQQSHGPASHEAGNVKLDARETVIIRNNRFVDESGWGIDLDDGSSNYHIYNNLCIGISIKLREGDYRLVENNVFINPANPPGIHIGYENNHDRFVGNIIVTNELSDDPEVDIDFVKDKADGSSFEFIGPPDKGGFVECIDYNLFFNSIGEFSATVYYRPLNKRVKHVYTLEEWREKGMDQHSLYADPLFLDYDNGDYSLKENSPAFGLGFKAFDMTRFGTID